MRAWGGERIYIGQSGKGRFTQEAVFEQGSDGSERVGGEGSVSCRGNSRSEDAEAVVCMPRGQRGYCRKERVKMRSENC